MAAAINFTASLMNAFENVGTEKTFSKGTLITREGDVEKNIYFISTGAVRLFYLTEYEEQIVRLGYDGSMINSLASFLSGRPSEFYLEVIRKTTIKILSKDQVYQLVNENEIHLQQYLKLMENLVVQQVDREIDLLITAPAERLERVLARSPNLFQHIPLKYIASYLRMKPETLSRIRNS